jgi:thioredoxin-like negative regulator of GroEL
MSRKEEIIKMLEADPDDTFLRYALAMELDSEGDMEASLKIYGELVNGTPPDVASHFRSAQILVRMGEIEKSRDILRSGIELARQQQDYHTAGEMSELLQQLGELE